MGLRHFFMPSIQVDGLLFTLQPLTIQIIIVILHLDRLKSKIIQICQKYLH